MKKKKHQLSEEGDGAISTGSIGGDAFSPSGEPTSPVIGNNAAYVPTFFGTAMRNFNTMKSKKKKKKKKSRKNESVGYEMFIDDLLKG